AVSEIQAPDIDDVARSAGSSSTKSRIAPRLLNLKDDLISRLIVNDNRFPCEGSVAEMAGRDPILQHFQHEPVTGRLSLPNFGALAPIGTGSQKSGHGGEQTVHDFFSKLDTVCYNRDGE